MRATPEVLNSIAPLTHEAWRMLTFQGQLSKRGLRQLKREVLCPNCRLRGNIARRLLFRSQRLNRIPWRVNLVAHGGERGAGRSGGGLCAARMMARFALTAYDNWEKKPATSSRSHRRNASLPLPLKKRNTG